MGTHYRLDRHTAAGWEFCGRYADKSLDEMQAMADALTEQQGRTYRIVLVEETEVYFVEPKRAV